MPVVASAPGKLMLLGEHAVIYNRSCLVTAANLRVSATVDQISSAEVMIRPGQGGVASGEVILPLREIVGQIPADVAARAGPEAAFVAAAAARALRRVDSPAGVTIHTNGPALSYGLGSSSAVAVAVVAALDRLLRLDLDRRSLFDLAYAAVLDVQGTGSGFDVAAAVYGGTLYYHTAGRNTVPLNVPPLPIVIGYSGEKVSTVSHVAEVAALRDRQPLVVDGIFDLMQHLVTAARRCLEVKNWATLGDLLNLNQGLLDALGVNTLSLARPIMAARAAGAWGAKLSGAGGGDCMFALVGEGHRAGVIAAMMGAGAQVLDLAIDAPGVTVVTV